MSDYTWLRVTVLGRDLVRFLAAIGRQADEDDVDDLGHHNFMYREAELGLYNELERAAADGCVFAGEHGQGGEYGPAVFASAGDGTCHNVVSDFYSYPVVRYHADTGADEQDVSHVQAYYRALERANALFGKPAVITVMEESLGTSQRGP